MKVAISSDTAIDMPKELLARFDIQTVPFTLTLGERTVADGEITPEELFAFTDKTGQLPRTAAVNEFQMEQHFRKLFEQGYEAIVHFDISSEMSSAYANAVSASKKFDDKVVVIDSRVLSTGIGLLAIYARKLADAGYPLPQIKKLVEERIPFDQTSFILESVNYLYKGGRCSALAALGANVLRLRPEIYVKNGKMGPGAKYRGPMQRFVASYVADTLKTFANFDPEVVFITYSTAPDDVVEQTRKTLAAAGFRNIFLTHAGGTVSCHCGPHCLGILYMNDGEHPIEPYQE